MPYKNYAKPAAAPVTEVMETSDVKAEPAADGSKKEAPAWLNKLKQGGIKKIPKDVQKRRRNYRLKKMLTPKPPMMVLFELINRNDIQFENFISDPITRLLKITAIYDGKKFEGIGPSKSIAKNICSEQILQHIAFRSCVKDVISEGSHGEEETPWTALASVALFKLFNDWQAQGVAIPSELLKSKAAPNLTHGEMKSEPMDDGVDDGVLDFGEKKAKKKSKAKEPKGPKTLPENPTSRHPVQLLNEMQGQLNYETHLEGAPPNVIFTISVEVDGQLFKGTATNKKEAKKLAAQSALGALYQVHYTA